MGFAPAAEKRVNHHIIVRRQLRLQVSARWRHVYDCPVFIDSTSILAGCPLTFELWRIRPGQDAELVQGCCVPSFIRIRDWIKGQSVTALQRCLCRSDTTSALNADTQHLETRREKRLDLNCPVVTLSPDVQSAWCDLILLLIFNPAPSTPQSQ